jgi:hypothetical protein
MKTKTILSLALCLLLSYAASPFATGNFVVSTFDSDLGSNPYGTNTWTDTVATALVWTNNGNPGGSMFVVSDWAQGTSGGYWEWQEHQAHLRPWDSSTNADRGLDVRNYSSINFDVFLMSDVSTTNLHGDYGGINVHLQGDPNWGNNGSGDTAWTYLGTAIPVITATNGGWQHFSLPTLAFPRTLSEIIFQFYSWANINSSMHTQMLIDNVEFIAIPEPTSLMILGCGLFGLAFLRRRQG